MVKTAERIISSGYLETKTLDELVDIYNSTNPKKRLRSFSCSAEAVRIVLERLLYLERRSIKRKGKIGSRRKPVNLPPRKVCLKKKMRTNIRVLLVAMLRHGTTVDEIRRKFKGSVNHRLKILNRDLGIGIKELEDGTLKIIGEIDEWP